MATFLLQALVPAYSLDINFIGWSLSVELVMYIVLFLVVARVDIQSKRYVKTVWIVWALSQAAFIYLVNLPDPGNESWYHFLFYHPVWHLNSFLWGILFCIYYLRYKDFFKTGSYTSLVLVIIGYLVILVGSFYLGDQLGLPRFYHNGFLAPLTGALILGLSLIEGSQKSSVFKSRYFDPLANTLGGISFGIYLFHVPVYLWMSPRYSIDSEAHMYLVYLAIVLFISWLSYLMLDLYLHKKTRFLEKLFARNNHTL
jgi:peptidoglycan/LPS O-acetylase OafA/YrhL